MKTLERLAPAPLTLRDDGDGGDGRTLTGLAVPFDVELTVADFWDEYDEVFRAGSFTKTLAEHPDMPLLISHEHRHPPVGAATRMWEAPDGLWADFHLSHTARADEVLELNRDGLFRGLSIGFEPVTDRKTSGRERGGGRDLMERLEVRLREVSLCNFAAYETAGVTAIRARRATPGLAALRAERERQAAGAAQMVDQWGRLRRR